MKKIFLFAVIVILFWSTQAFALPILNPNNGHYYDAIGGNYDWEEARNLAAGSSYLGLPGHLATLTSVAESVWVWTNLSQPGMYLLGGTDRTTEGIWEWVTGEPWIPANTNWNLATGEPNNSDNGIPGADENALSFWINGKWNDLPDTKNIYGDGTVYIKGYVVEYVPEPLSCILFMVGGVSLAAAGYRRRKKSR